MGIKISIFLRSARKSGTLFEMSASGSGTRKKIRDCERDWHSIFRRRAGARVALKKLGSG